MRRWAGTAALVALTLAGAGAARADQPLLMPNRDADVLYRLLPDSGPDAPVLTERMRWREAAREQRLDPPEAVAHGEAQASGMYLIVNFALGRMLVVQPATRTLYEMAAPANATIGAAPGAAASSYRRDGADRVAGLPCAIWSGTDDSGHAVQLCVSADGILLRARQDGHTLVQAQSVSLAPQDPALFQAPAGWRVLRPRAAAEGGR